MTVVTSSSSRSRDPVRVIPGTRAQDREQVQVSQACHRLGLSSSTVLVTHPLITSSPSASLTLTVSLITSGVPAAAAAATSGGMQREGSPRFLRHHTASPSPSPVKGIAFSPKDRYLFASCGASDGKVSCCWGGCSLSLPSSSSSRSVLSCLISLRVSLEKKTRMNPGQLLLSSRSDRL